MSARLPSNVGSLPALEAHIAMAQQGLDEDRYGQWPKIKQVEEMGLCWMLTLKARLDMRIRQRLELHRGWTAVAMDILDAQRIADQKAFCGEYGAVWLNLGAEAGRRYTCFVVILCPDEDTASMLRLIL